MLWLGPVTIANQAGKTLSYSFMMFIDLVAKLSISLALINILPIPALDGGHLLIVLIEGLRRKELNTKTKIVIQNFGVLFLFIFMLIILYIDILRI
jgi:Predicted membrane-associated Zn-dependent proteases 1